MKLIDSVKFNPKAYHVDFEGLENRNYSIGQWGKSTSADLRDPVIQGFRSYEDGAVEFRCHLSNEPDARRVINRITNGTVIVERVAEVSFSDVVTGDGEKVTKKYLRAEYFGSQYGFGEMQWRPLKLPLVWEDTESKRLVPYSCHYESHGVQYPNVDAPPTIAARWLVGQINKERHKADMSKDGRLARILEIGRVSHQLGVKPFNKMVVYRGIASSQPYMTCHINAFVECVLQDGSTNGEVAVAAHLMRKAVVDHMTWNHWCDFVPCNYLMRVSK